MFQEIQSGSPRSFNVTKYRNTAKQSYRLFPKLKLNTVSRDQRQWIARDVKYKVELHANLYINIGTLKCFSLPIVLRERNAMSVGWHYNIQCWYFSCRWTLDRSRSTWLVSLGNGWVTIDWFRFTDISTKVRLTLTQSYRYCKVNHGYRAATLEKYWILVRFSVRLNCDVNWDFSREV